MLSLTDRSRIPGFWISGTMSCSRTTVISSPTDHRESSIEVIEGQYRDFRFALPLRVDDNASSGRLVAVSVAASLDLFLKVCMVKPNGQVVDSATGSGVVRTRGRGTRLGHQRPGLAADFIIWAWCCCRNRMRMHPAAWEIVVIGIPAKYCGAGRR